MMSKQLVEWDLTKGGIKMANVAKIDEILKEIRTIEMSQEEVEQYIRNLQKEEECSYEILRNDIRNIDIEFEACQGDQRLTRLVEERYSQLQQMERECGQFLAELHEEQAKIKYQCECDIDDLRQEMRRLEMEVL